MFGHNRQRPSPNAQQEVHTPHLGPGVVRIRWKLLSAGTLIDLWLNPTKASRKAYPSKFRHLVYVDGTMGLHVLNGIPAGTRVAVKGRVVRADGGRSHYAQAEIVV